MKGGEKVEEKNVKIEFSLSEDNFKLLENDGYCSIAEIDFLHLGTNRNNCNISQECVEKSLNSFYNKPLLAILNNDFIPSMSTDFVEHARKEEETKRFVAFGTIPESSTFSFVTRDNGKTYLNAKVVIWKNYFPIIMNILKNRGGSTKVSIELAVIDGKQDDTTGILDIYEFRLLSCVMLGADIMEGIEGSHLDMLRFSCDKEIQEANKYFLEFSNNSLSYEIPLTIKNSVMQQLKNNDRKGCTPEDIKIAQTLALNNSLSKYQIKKLNNYLTNSHSSLVLNLLGGEETRDWVKNILEEREGENSMNSMSNSELQEQIWNELGKYKYHDGEWEGRKYYVEEIYSDEKIAIIRDNETAEFFKVPYSIENGKVNVNMEAKKEVHKDYTETKNFSAKNAVVFAKEDYGKGKTIKVNKSKEAMSETAWGSVNKTELRKKVLDAKNYKSLVKDVYMIVEEGWEEAPSSKLKYPVMEIKGGEAVYNRYGLASALAYAGKENETEVIKKVESLYKKLDIDNDDEKGGEKKMEKEEIKNKLDEDNKDIEKIRDDAEAQEDDVKEEEKKNSCEEIIENKIDKDDEGEEGLEDDVDADKDYWEKKANALEEKYSKMEAELNKYKREEEERKMYEEIDKFAHCMSEEEVKEMKNSVKECSFEEMKNKLNEKIADFALKMKKEPKAEEEKEEVVKYSVNPYFDIDAMKFNKLQAKDLDDIINNNPVKIG